MSITIPWRDKPQTQSLILGCFTLLICLLVAGVSWLTKPHIALRELEDTQSMLSQVFPTNLYDNQLGQAEYNKVLDGKPVHYFLASKGGIASGIIVYADTVGYSGTINMLLGIDSQGNVTGVRVINHKETPGLGDNIELSKSSWILSFDGKSLQNTTEQQWHVKKDGGEFDAFTGATITPRAVVKGIHESLQLFQRHKAVLLNPAQGE